MNLTHHFLLSMPHQQDAGFKDSLVYILEHGKDGAFGVIINQDRGMNLGDVFSQLSIDSPIPGVAGQTVLRGGPVDEGHGLVLHPPGPRFQITRDFSDGISLSSSRDILEALACGEEPSTYSVLLGHSGWAPGQLEMEVANNAWLTCDATAEIIFDTPLAQRRQAAGNLLGIDLSQVVGDSGHA